MAKRKKSKIEKVFDIALGCIFLTLALLPATFICFLVVAVAWYDPIIFRMHTRQNLSDWENYDYGTSDTKQVARINYIIPKSDESNGYFNASFCYTYNKFPFEFSGYCEYSACLDLFYDETTYLFAKEQALSSYLFLEEPIALSSSDETSYELPASETTLGSYHIKLIDLSTFIDEPSYFSCYIGFLAWNDETNNLRFCYIDNYLCHKFYGTSEFLNYLTQNLPVKWE